jgi:membrane protease YdiL (CAAX protease family)
MNSKGIIVYLMVVFGLGYICVPLMTHYGLIVFAEPNLFNNIAFLAVLWIPAVAAMVASMAARLPKEDRMKIWPLPINRAMGIIVAVPLLFAAIHAAIWAFGWSGVQWSLPAIQDAISQQNLPPAVTAILIPVAVAVLSVLLGATIYPALALGHEIGWRGYLLPRLMYWGRGPAYVLTGLLWFVWVLPLVYTGLSATNNVSEFWGFLPRLAVAAVALSAILGEIWRKDRHVGLTALFVGGFFAQDYYGIWQYLFPMIAEPWTGTFGIISLAVWIVAALLLVFQPRKPVPCEETAEDAG